MNQRATENNLNKEEFEQLKEAYVSTIVDSMSMKDLVDYVKTDYYNCVDKLTEHDLIEDINIHQTKIFQMKCYQQLQRIEGTKCV